MAFRKEEDHQQQISQQRPLEGVLKSPEDVKRAICDVVSISPDTLRAVKRLFHLTSEYLNLNQEINRPQMLAAIERYPDLLTITRLGYYFRIIAARRAVREAADAFLTNLNLHYTSDHTLRKFKKPEDLRTYRSRYLGFRRTVEIVEENTDSQFAGWMGKSVNLADLDAENQLRDLASTKQIGEVVYDISKQRQRLELRGLSSIEYTDLAELFTSIVMQEARQTTIMPLHQTTRGETLAHVLFDLATSYEVQFLTEVIQRMPPVVKDSYKNGLPFYQLLLDFLKELPAALSHYDHPGHVITRRLVHELNGFQVEGRERSEELHTMMFNHYLAANLIEQDFNGYGNFQEFVYRLGGLARRDDPNQVWYRALLDNFVMASKYFSFKIATEAADIDQHIMDMKRIPPTPLDIGDKLADILSVGEYETLTVLVNEGTLPIEYTAMRGNRYTSFFFAERTGPDTYLLKVELIAEQAAPDAAADQLAEESIKFRCELKIVDNAVQMYLPVVHKERLHPGAELAIVQHVRRVLSLVEVDVLQEKETEKGKSSPHPDTTKKAGNRDERKQAHQSARQANESRGGLTVEIKPSTTPLQQSIETVKSADKEVISVYPQTLVLSADLARRVNKQKEKGRFAWIYADLQAFIAEYNAAPIKPGKGIHMDGVRGPSRETVWRFKPSTKTRCIVVEVPDSTGNTVGLIVHADDRNDVYEDKGEMRKIVNAAVSRYTPASE